MVQHLERKHISPPRIFENSQPRMSPSRFGPRPQALPSMSRFLRPFYLDHFRPKLTSSKDKVVAQMKEQEG